MENPQTYFHGDHSKDIMKVETKIQLLGANNNISEGGGGSSGFDSKVILGKKGDDQIITHRYADDLHAILLIFFPNFFLAFLNVRGLIRQTRGQICEIRIHRSTKA